MADGPAIELMLSEKPIKPDSATNYISVGLDGMPHHWSERTGRLNDKKNRIAWATDWYTQPAGAKVKDAEIRFGKMERGKPVEGEYNLTLQDGTIAKGKFRAEWLQKKRKD